MEIFLGFVLVVLVLGAIWAVVDGFSTREKRRKLGLYKRGDDE